eukprot:scaffold2500_cov176-Amphora_coffeaeformis.AAC.4
MSDAVEHGSDPNICCSSSSSKWVYRRRCFRVVMFGLPVLCVYQYLLKVVIRRGVLGWRAHSSCLCKCVVSCRAVPLLWAICDQIFKNTLENFRHLLVKSLSKGCCCGGGGGRVTTTTNASLILPSVPGTPAEARKISYQTMVPRRNHRMSTTRATLDLLLSAFFASLWGATTAKTVRPKPVRPLHHSSRQHNPLSVEQGLWPTLVLGSDESGTGALAGPLVTATVACVDPRAPDAILKAAVRDSKTLTLAQREEIYDQVMGHPLYHCTVAVRQAEEIDEAANIQAAVNEAFGECISNMVNNLSSRSERDELFSIVDGKSSIPNLPIASRPWIKGDTTVYTVALASVVARVTRDRLVQETAAELYPEYGFEQHGGYPNQAHWHALHTYGPTPYHRRSCKLVRQRDTTSSSATSRSDFLQGALWIAAGIATATGSYSEPANGMYTDKKTGIQFPEEGEIAAAIPKEWDADELEEIVKDTSRYQRLDGSSDAIFYQEPRFVEHVDDGAVQRMSDYLNQFIVQPADVRSVLDLCSSWTSHLPDKSFAQLDRVAGLGMNAKELQANPSLTEWVVANLNDKPDIPFEEKSFDTVICQLSIDYLTKPVQVCREIGRVLKPGGTVHILFSNRLFLSKAVAGWTGADDIDHAYTVGQYLKATKIFEQIAAQDLSARRSGKIVGDPLYVVTAKRTL